VQTSVQRILDHKLMPDISWIATLLRRDLRPRSASAIAETARQVTLFEPDLETLGPADEALAAGVYDGAVAYAKFAPVAADVIYRLLDASAQAAKLEAFRALTAPDGASDGLVHNLDERAMADTLIELFEAADSAQASSLPKSAVKQVLLGAELGLSQRDLARQVRQAFFGEEAQRVQRGRDEVKVMVRYPEANRRSLQDLDDLRIRTQDGAEAPLSEVAEASFGRGYASITRVDQKRIVRVSGDVDENDPNASPEAINQELREKLLPDLVARYPGLGWSFEGDQKNKADLLRSLFTGFIFALFLIYALIAIPLKSYTQPLLIMTAIPYGFGGAILGHIVTGLDLSIMSMFGSIALAGVVVNDNIVMVDAVNQRREAGASLIEAVRDAGSRRFRPLLVTSVTTFGGLAPLLLEQSVQAKFLIPMAVSLGFGVMFATTISLLIVPSMYLAMDDLRRGLAWLYAGKNDSEPATQQ
jgi:hypothetical protein